MLSEIKTPFFHFHIIKMSQTNKKITSSRFRLDIAQKVAIIERYNLGDIPNHEELGIWAKTEFNLKEPVKRRTISKLLGESEEIYKRAFEKPEKDLKSKSARGPKMPELDEDISIFINDMAQKRVPINRESVVKFAKVQAIRKYRMLELPEKERITFSDGWVSKVFRRIGVKSRRLHGDNASVDLTSENIVEQLKKIEKLLEPYDPKDILNFDETGLYYEQSPTRTICSKPMGGSKKSKKRFTVGLLCNADGTYKGHPIVIGNMKKPAGSDRKPRLYAKLAVGQTHYIEYHYNKSAWMTSEIFFQYIHKLNRSFAYENKKIALLLDNASVHKLTQEFSHVKLIFLPAYTTSKLQPLDAGNNIDFISLKTNCTVNTFLNFF